MTTTSLQEYLADINQLLEDEQHEAVVGHSYHILKQYPRHVDTYRALAKGLLGLNRQDEATELFQRILSADPHDLIAHIALADVAQMNGDSDVAQYHLERAFELDPYNGALQDELKRYYDSGDDFGMGRIQLNETSLAHLYMRGELYDQATTVLEGLVENENGRIDLQLLLAEALWRKGNRVEAAEVSLRVLDNLPNCIVANAILTEIWLGSDRVGDAKKHARNLQSMVLVDKQSIDPESVVGTALTSGGSLKLPNQIQIDTLDTITSEDVAVSIQEIKPNEDASQDDIESDPGDMYDWLSGVVKPSAEQRMEEVLEPDSWPAGESDLESDWFSNEAVSDDTAVDDSLFDEALEFSEQAELEPEAVADEAIFNDTFEFTDQPQPESEPAPAFEDLFEDSQKDTADEFVLEFNKQAEENADVPDWIVTDNADTGELSASQDSMDLFPTDEEGIPDWLTQAANEDFEPVQLDPLTASQWLNEGNSDDPVDDDVENDDFDNLPASVKESQDWLADINREFTEIVDDPAEEAEAEDWLQDDTLADEQEPSEIDDWLSAISESPLDDDTQPPADDILAEQDAESDDWLNNIADQALLGDTFENESNPTLETKIVDDPAPDLEGVGSDDDWFSDEDWLLDDNTAVADDSAAAEVQDLAPIMNNDEPINGKEQPKKENEPKEEQQADAFSEDWLSQLTKDNDDDDDWLAELAGSDNDIDLGDESGVVEEGDSVSDFLAELGVSEEVEPLEDGEPLEDINQWLEDLSSEQGESPDDWLSNLVDEEGDEETDKIFTDWLNQSVVDDHEQNASEVESEPAADLLDDLEDFSLETDLLEEENLTGLTDVLDDFAKDEEVAESEPVISEAEVENWLDEEGGFTDLLNEAAAESPSAMDSVDISNGLSDVTDLLDETPNEEVPSDLIAESDGDWLDENSSLTDILAEADVLPDELVGEETSAADEADLMPSLTDLLDDSELTDSSPLEEIPSLTDMLAEQEADAPLDDMIPSLTDMLESEELTSAESVESDGDWLEEEGGLTGLLSEAGLTFDDSDSVDKADALVAEPSLTDMLESDNLPHGDDLEEGLPSLTDMLESDNLPSEIAADSNDDWLSEEGGLTDMLSDIDLTFDSSDGGDTAVEQDDLVDLAEPPSLTELLGEEPEEPEPVQPADGDWLNDESGLTDLLAESDPFETKVEDEPEVGLTDMLADDVGLTDMLAESEPSLSFEEEQPINEPGLTDLLGEENASIDDLLADEDEGTGLTDLLAEASLIPDDEEEVPTLTDMLNPPDEESMVDDEFGYEQPDLDEILESGLIDNSDEDALAAIDTNLPEWLSAGEANEETKSSIPDWMTEESPEIDLDLDEDDAEIDSQDVEPARASATGLLRKLDDIPSLKASIEAEEEAQRKLEEDANFEPEMADYLTKPSDTAWLNQLADNDEASDQSLSELDWMKDVSSDPDLDWLDSGGEEEETLIEESVEEEPEVDSFVDEDRQDTPGDLDDAMSWLEDLAAEQEKPIEPLPTVAEVLDEDELDVLSAIAADDPVTNEGEAAEEPVTADIISDEDQPSESQVDETLAEIDDAMTWLDDLTDQVDELADESNSLIAEAEEQTSSSQPLFETPAETFQEEAVPADELDTGADDVPDDIDDAMAWLEQLAAKQGAPLEELPSISEDETAVIESESTIQYSKPIETDDESIPSELASALNWIEEISEPAESDVTPVEKTTTAELGDALDWLENIANQPVETEAEPPAEEPADDTGLDVAVEESDPLGEEESPEDGESIEALFDTGAFDFPDDPDEAMAWLDELSEDEIAENRAARGDDPDDDLDFFGSFMGGSSSTKDVIEEDEEVDEPEETDAGEESETSEDTSVEEAVESDESSVEEESEDESDEFIEELFDTGAFDFPDDPDEAMAWLGELSEDEIAENRAARGDEPEDDFDMFGSFLGASASTKEVEEAIDAPEEVPTADELAPEETDEAQNDVSDDEIAEESVAPVVIEENSDIITNVPEDPDEAMKWLEQLAAKQGAPLEELPSVTEPVEVDDVPDWIKGATEEAATGSSDSGPGTSPLPTLEPETDAEEELPDGLPDWFSLDDDAQEDEIPSQAEWLDSVPEFGGTDWLSSEGEAASTASESTDLLPDTGPLVDPSGSTGPLPDLNPLESQPELYNEPAVNDEPDSAVYKLNSNQLEVAKSEIESKQFDGAISTLQTMVADGNGLMMLIGELETISDENPNQPAFRRLLGDAYMRNGQLQKALTTYRQALDQL